MPDRLRVQADAKAQAIVSLMAEGEKLAKVRNFVEAAKAFAGVTVADPNYTMAWLREGNMQVRIADAFGMKAWILQEERTKLNITQTKENYEKNYESYTATSKAALLRAIKCYETAANILEAGNDSSGIKNTTGAMFFAQKTHNYLVNLYERRGYASESLGDVIEADSFGPMDSA